MKRVLAAVVASAGMALLLAAAPAMAATYQCFQVHAPYQSYPSPGSCPSGYAQVALSADTTQVLTVTNTKQASTYARFNAFSLTGGTWTHTRGPWTARIGSHGFADPGQKIEGTPSLPRAATASSSCSGSMPTRGCISPGGTPTATTTGTTTRTAHATTCGLTPGASAQARIPSRCTTSRSTTTRRSSPTTSPAPPAPGRRSSCTWGTATPRRDVSHSPRPTC